MDDRLLSMGGVGVEKEERDDTLEARRHCLSNSLPTHETAFSWHPSPTHDSIHCSVSLNCLWCVQSFSPVKLMPLVFFSLSHLQPPVCLWFSFCDTGFPLEGSFRFGLLLWPNICVQRKFRVESWEWKACSLKRKLIQLTYDGHALDSGRPYSMPLSLSLSSWTFRVFLPRSISMCV